MHIIIESDVESDLDYLMLVLGDAVHDCEEAVATLVLNPPTDTTFGVSTDEG